MFSGYKTYICAGIALFIGIDKGLIQAGYNLPDVPNFILFILTALGLYSARSGASDEVAKATASLVNLVAFTKAADPKSDDIIAKAVAQAKKMNEGIIEAPLPDIPGTKKS